MCWIISFRCASGRPRVSHTARWTSAAALLCAAYIAASEERKTGEAARARCLITRSREFHNFIRLLAGSNAQLTVAHHWPPLVYLPLAHIILLPPGCPCFVSCISYPCVVIIYMYIYKYTHVLERARWACPAAGTNLGFFPWSRLCMYIYTCIRMQEEESRLCSGLQ